MYLRMNKLKACNKVNKLHELEKRIKAMILIYGRQKVIKKLYQMARQRLIYLGELEGKILVTKDGNIYDYTGDSLELYIPDNQTALDMYISIKYINSARKAISSSN
jgi:hypothetical protein